MASHLSTILLRQVSFEVRSENPLLAVASTRAVSLRVLGCKPLSKKEIALLVELQGSREDVRDVVTGIRKLDGVKEVVPEKLRGMTLPILVVMRMPSICSASMDHPIICIECPFNSTGSVLNWRFLVQETRDLDGILRNLSQGDIRVRIKDSSPVRTKSPLTPRQSEIVAAAVEMGYFEYPRRVGLTTLSQVIGIKPSTLCEVLRTAERRIVQRNVERRGLTDA